MKTLIGLVTEVHYKTTETRICNYLRFGRTIMLLILLFALKICSTVPSMDFILTSKDCASNFTADYYEKLCQLVLFYLIPRPIPSHGLLQ